MKISVILPTNKRNSPELLKEMRNISSITRKKTIFNEDFTLLSGWGDCRHYLYPTLECLSKQIFLDYEVIICHKYPEDLNDLIDFYPKLKLIKEKPSIWHQLGNYPTVNNNRNTGIMNAKGELLVFLDDMTIFNKHLLRDIWNTYKDGYYSTAKAIRRIRYNPDAKVMEKGNRKTYVDNGIYGAENFHNINIGDKIHNAATWTYCCSMSREECLEINGFDEIYDGNFGGTDQDIGRRLIRISKYKRKLIGNIYEFAHKSHKHTVRYDEMFRQICGQSPIPKHIRANSWKPTPLELKRYKRWHLHTHGEMDVNWNKFMDIPLYNIK